MGEVETSSRRIGLLGGTFDPIHTGHLIVAQVVLEKFNLEKIVFIPTGIPPHKKWKEVTDPYHRYMMTVLATNLNPLFEVSRFEIEKEGPSYSIDTIRHFNEFYQDGDLFFITGIDTILDLITWKDYQHLPELCDFICATRPHFSFEALNQKVYRHFPQLKHHVHYVNVPLIQISSTDIRDRCKNGQSISYMVPDQVAAYIKKEGLYQKGVQ